MSNALPFRELTPDLAVGEARPGWQPIAAADLLILVGVTGVGKSTLLAQAPVQALNLTLLPDRRVLTDHLIIPAMQAARGEASGPVRDRGHRFALTRAYREQHLGGMAHALRELLVRATTTPRYLFDGLRGDNEVTHAAAALPRSRFVMLDAPDLVRVRRLLGRGDAFDRIAAPPSGSIIAGDTDLAAAGLDAARDLFSEDEMQAMLGWVRQGDVTAADLAAKLAIVVEERRNYDPAATKSALMRHAPDRTLILDTDGTPALQLADRLARWLTQE